MKFLWDRVLTQVYEFEELQIKFLWGRVLTQVYEFEELQIKLFMI